MGINTQRTYTRVNELFTRMGLADEVRAGRARHEEKGNNRRQTGADVTLFEVGRRVEYLPRHKEKTKSQKVTQKENEIPITAKGKEGKGAHADGGNEGRRARLTGKMQI